ncbi:threonylcarbamoyl-AMP synthase [Fulvimarina endophytica]|uniref:Threonylcarbamoyl-AMP synthase n=1 Tax=Fulvimarina endophytica TaxID=2293836 RepID=A0A371WZM9_9HYPH|nr:L-threonylcarbamoyladenylate synthase [Fulvimarina endophytica]RFC62441.1 threonylcarbamoyl-AMP synthase [Fulvimarina endophytica]
MSLSAPHPEILPVGAGDRDAIDAALKLLDAGRCVVVPTETVYGLAADATNGEAAASIFEAKGRPSFNPLICHVASMAMAARHAEVDPVAHKLMTAFWPGPLTIVLDLAASSEIHPLVTAGLMTVGLRMPRGGLRELAERLGRPLAAPSANRSGGVSPTTAEHAARSLGSRVPLILDAGRTEVGVESTIVRVAGDHVVLLRPGGITRDELREAVGLPIVDAGEGGAITAPGQLSSHYAPFGSVRLDAAHVEPGEWLISFGRSKIEGRDHAAGEINLSPAGDLREAAANLFGALSSLDRPDVKAIAVASVPRTGLGEAINDRLRRAAAPR